jgi:predicted RNase H-like nuclease (RuvC/YqgF family)
MQGKGEPTMTTGTATEVQFDHKHWLRDIERWNFYGAAWHKQVHDLTREYRRLLKTVEEYADDLEEFNDAVESHRNRLVADERTMTDPRRPAALAAELVKNHELNGARHEELYKAHERLKQVQHTLSMGLAVFKQEPFRGE